MDKINNGNRQNTIVIPCNIGDKIRYTDEYRSFDFIVKQIVIDEEEIRIYDDKGCVVYARNFEEYCIILN